MGQQAQQQNWHEEASKHYGVALHRHSFDEYAGPCPVCGGKDRFIVFRSGNAWCRKCQLKDWWNKPDDIAASLAEEARERAEVDQRARVAMVACDDWQEYHNNLGEKAKLWEERLGKFDSIAKWQLGYCERSPAGVPSLTIPVFRNGALVDIRHRLIEETPQSGKYRSHVAGLLPSPFNLDVRKWSKRVILVEGEVKTINLVDGGFPNTIGIPGVATFSSLVADLTGDDSVVEEAIILFDPDKGADQGASKLTDMLLEANVGVLVADSFMKPDDIVLQFGSNVLEDVLAQARRRSRGGIVPKSSLW